MLTMRIGLVSQSVDVDFPALVRVANALNIQITRDLTPIWGVSGTVAAIESADHLDPGVWPVYIIDQLDDDMAGFHLTEHNQPFAMVKAGDTWSLSASHEIIEMLVDPSGNRLVASTAVAVIDNEVQDAIGKFEYLVEVCDPSEDPSCSYLVDGVLVSDFYTPSYFDPAGSLGARYSFSGRITRPRQVLPNGYLSWFNAATNKLQQVRHFGAPQIVDLASGRPGSGSLTAGQSLRSFIDGVTRPPQALAQLRATTQKVQQRDLRRVFLAGVAPVRANMFTAAASDAMNTLASMKAVRAASVTRDVISVLNANVAVFSKPGVLSVRPGLSIGPRGMTNERVIVATVQPDRLAELRISIPGQIDGISVELRVAGPVQIMRMLRPADYVAIAAARHELRQPDFDNQLFFDEDGKLIGGNAPLTALLAAHVAKPRIDYTSPPGATLDPVTGPVSLVLHTSPDAGWDQLSNFLAGVKQELVVGMYDFTSGHILAALKEAMSDEKRLTLTLDHPAPNPSRDQTDEDTQRALADLMRDHFASAWALTNSDPKAPVWIYPNAYHIKVAVREDDTFWLSSGNWNNSNQPEIDLSDPAAARKIAASHDRDWHVIVTSKPLANTFRAFLQHDYEVASSEEEKVAVQGMVQPKGIQLPEVPAEAFAAGRVPRTFFQPKTVAADMKVQPLLTPDNYHEHVKTLIESSRKTFYMQTQYIHPSGRAGDEGHDALIAAVKVLVDAGVDVRLITSEFQTDDWVEKVVSTGIPPAVLRRQPKVHNKGVVVDSSVVMVSSQNWSADGTLRNRDAGLIIYSPEAAKYFEQIFLHDWDHLASPIGRD